MLFSFAHALAIAPVLGAQCDGERCARPGRLGAASNFKADGTITLVLDKSATGLTTPLHTLDRLTAISASVRMAAADDPSGSAGSGAGLTVDGAGDPNPYVVAGNDTCLIASDRIFAGGFE